MRKISTILIFILAHLTQASFETKDTAPHDDLMVQCYLVHLSVKSVKGITASTYI